MSETREEIPDVEAILRNIERLVEELGRRIQAVEATLERAERAAIRREERQWNVAS